MDNEIPDMKDWLLTVQDIACLNYHITITVLSSFSAAYAHLQYFPGCCSFNAQVDRSPCGSGTTALAALQYHYGQIALGQKRVFQNSKTKSQFTAAVVREAIHGSYKGVVVEVTGHGYYTGEGLYVREASDDLGRGFLID